MPVDQELIEHITPEKPSVRELEWKDRISVEDFSVYITKLELICDEAKQKLIDLSSSMTGQMADCIVGIYTAEGDLALASAGTYLHVATGVIPIKYVLRHYKDDPTVLIEEGDMFFCNEALYGGIHSPDMLNLIPVFWEGELIAWVVAAAHVPETGASEPGGYVPYARSRYEEGLKVPPLKIMSKFKYRSDVEDLLGNMVRSRESFDTDMKARASAGFKARERVLEIAREKGSGFLAGLLRRVIEAIEQGVKARVSQLCDGTFRHCFFLDVAGYEEGLRVVHIAVIKKGDTITVDLSGSSPPTVSFVNAKAHTVRAMFLGDLMQGMFADFPVSSAICSPFKVVAPENTLVNAPDDSALAGCMRVVPQVVNGIHTCLAKMLYASGFQELATSARGIYNGTAGGGGYREDGSHFTWGTTDIVNAGGNSATPTGDGADAAHFWWSGFADCGDVEHMELQVPTVVLFRRIIADHSGPGKFRGGAAASACYIVRGSHNPIRVVWGGSAVRMPLNPGVSGGYYSTLTPFVEMRGINWEELFTRRRKEIPYDYYQAATKWATGASSLPDQRPFPEGDAVIAVAGSAGGYGDCLERDPGAVLLDVRKGLVSFGVARQIYAVAFDEATLKVNYSLTEKLRQEVRDRRKKEGRPYAKFEKEWLIKKPKAEMLAHYGPWPWALGAGYGTEP